MSDTIVGPYYVIVSPRSGASSTFGTVVPSGQTPVERVVVTGGKRWVPYGDKSSSNYDAPARVEVHLRGQVPRAFSGDAANFLQVFGGRREIAFPTVVRKRVAVRGDEAEYLAGIDMLAELVGADPVLKRGSKGAAVRVAQGLLFALGYKVVIDGDFAFSTYNAVIAFQASRGLPPSGVIDEKTWVALRAAVPLPSGDFVGPPAPSAVTFSEEEAGEAKARVVIVEKLKEVNTEVKAAADAKAAAATPEEKVKAQAQADAAKAKADAIAKEAQKPDALPAVQQAAAQTQQAAQQTQVAQTPAAAVSASAAADRAKETASAAAPPSFLLREYGGAPVWAWGVGGVSAAGVLALLLKMILGRRGAAVPA